MASSKTKTKAKAKTGRPGRPATITSRDGLAAAYGVSRTGADRWLLRPDWPAGPPWQTAEIDAYLDRIGSPFAPSRAAVRKAKGQSFGVVPAGDKGTASSYERKLAAEARCKEADARKKELLFRQLQGVLVERAAANATMRKIIIMVKNRVENMPDQLAMILPPAVRGQAVADLREAVRLILVEMASMGPDANDTTEG